ncbi:hypothetical protein MPTK2_Ug00390 [Marchantia polymorpha subsp. ruderalis]
MNPLDPSVKSPGLEDTFDTCPGIKEAKANLVAKMLFTSARENFGLPNEAPLRF